MAIKQGGNSDEQSLDTLRTKIINKNPNFN